MESLIEKHLTLPHVTVNLATVQWGEVTEVDPSSRGYNICQRLSDRHAPLRIGNVNAHEAFPRFRSVAFLPPDCPVRLYPLEQPFRVLNCSFDKDYFEEITEITEEHWQEHTGALVAIKDRRLEAMMQEIYGELLQPDFAQDILIEAATTMILVEMARYGRRLDEVSGRGAAGHGLAPWQLRRIHERLESAIEIGYPGLDELAQLCGISQSHLMRTFKMATGWPIHKYIAEQRSEAAKLLLLEENLNSKEIAARLGFRSAAYFATAFRKATGKTPTEFRREARAGMVGTA